MFSQQQTELQSTLLDDQLKVDTRNGGGLEFSSNGQYDTLRESICVSLKRELLRIWNKTQYAIIPRCSAAPEKNLRQWDLWGPLAICILLCVTISVGRDGTSTDTSFISVFAIVWFGGIIITFNAQFLGAKIGICQSICLLGYCVFPILIGAIINRIMIPILLGLK